MIFFAFLLALLLVEICTMGKASLTDIQVKDFARTLFIHSRDITAKELAARTGAPERSIAKWIRTENWETLRLSLLTSRRDQLGRLYLILSAVTEKVEAKDGVGDASLADLMIRYTAAIRALETETSITAIVETMMLFGTFVQRCYPEQFRLITEISDGFVQEQLK